VGSALICNGTVSGQHGVSTGSGSDRVSLAISDTSRNDPVVTAPGTDLILKSGHYRNVILVQCDCGKRILRVISGAGRPCHFPNVNCRSGVNMGRFP
jgi:hypothetical protein